ncbi:MAG: formate dehydrogenase accessory sulfurtransferase FdhD [Candidatus Bathyarchaeia archaeon]|nr:formate dehydrogenase accessory sulfurtransferase FdhD [Candidatus Bathyarchaeota archaeon]
MISTFKTIVKKLDLNKGLAEDVLDEVAVEIPLKLYINGEAYATLMVTPNQLKELTIGFLISEGVIKSIDEIKEFKIENSFIKVELRKKEKLSLPNKVILTACTSSEEFLNQILNFEKPIVESNYVIKASKISEMLEECIKKAEIYKATGATHFAGIFQNEELKAFSEDVGRHNAVDKAIGLAILKNVELQKTVLISSGRQPADIVLKVAKAGIPILASMRAPLMSGVNAARILGVTLIGFARKLRMNIYSFPERILLG